MIRRTLLTFLIAVFLLSDGYAAEVQNLIIKVDKARDIHKIEKKYKVHVLKQIEDQPIFLVQAKHSKKLLKKLGKEKKVVSLEPDLWFSLDTGSETDSGGGLGLDWSVMSLFWSVMSLFGDKDITEFYGTEVIEGYAQQPALDVIHVSDIRSITSGAGTRIAFIDTGVDPDHPALRPWVESGVDLLGTGSASELSGLDWSVMSLFEDMVRLFKRGLALDWSVMSLFMERLEEAGLDWSVMSLFWSVMSLFSGDVETMDLDWSVMSLFWEEFEKLNLDWSVMSLFWSVMSLFAEEVEQLHLDWSVMSLFGEGDASTGGTLPPKFGHGTLVAGLIHAVAPEASLVPIRAFDFQGNSTLFLTTAAVYAAVDLNVDVINMSFSIGEDSRAFREALDYAWSHGVTLVASVGNDGIDAGDIYPAAYHKVIAVAATDLDDHIAPFSNYGKAVDVTAPGVIVSTYPGGLYARASGTSFSAPLVSGSVALLVSLGQRNNAATQTIVRTADSIDKLNPDFKKALGEGRINLLNAIEGH